MKIECHIVSIGETKTYGNNGFKKREIIVETTEQYSQKLPIEFVQDKCQVLDKYAEGQNVSISINIRGNSWTNPQGVEKHFVSLQGWKIESLEGATTTPQQQTDGPIPMDEIFPPVEDEEDDDDIGF